MPSAHTSPKFERTSCSDLETWLILAANQFKCRWLFSRCCLLRRRQQRRLQLSFCFILFCSVFCCLCITPFFVWHFSHIWVGKHYSRSRVSLNGILQKNPIRVVRVIKTGKASAHVHLVWLFFLLSVCGFCLFILLSISVSFSSCQFREHKRVVVAQLAPLSGSWLGFHYSLHWPHGPLNAHVRNDYEIQSKQSNSTCFAVANGNLSFIRLRGNISTKSNSNKMFNKLLKRITADEDISKFCSFCNKSASIYEPRPKLKQVKD